ncbi:MAG: glycosyltransferase [Candidatus Sumerlaeia bacterium]|nr:glycosyltransferase [Candidatus Sumerlaeia bacterium]
MSTPDHHSAASASRPLRVLSIWHGAVRALNRERYDALVESGDLELTVLAPTRWSAAMPRLLDLEPGGSERYRLIAASAWLRRHAAFHVYPRLISILARTRPDIIDLYEEPYTFIAWLVAWWRNQFAPGTRLVFTACQNISKRYPPPFRQMERYVLQSADAAMALNREAVGVFRAKGYDGPFEVVPTGIDPARLHRVDAGDLRRNLGLTRPTVGYLGRLVEEKGVATLLEALAVVNDGSFQLLLVGDGPEKATLRRRAHDLRIADHVVWADSIGSESVARYLSAMDVLVLPSLTRPHWKEQLGRVLIEAMACETAVVGSDSGAIPEVIGDAGLIFPEGNALELRAALDRLIGDAELRRDLAARGRRRAESEFNWATIASRIRAVWAAACERRPLELRRRG